MARLIDQLLADERTERAVARYYDADSDFAGHTFLDLAPNEPCAFGPPDLFAAALLEGNPGPKAARRLLAGGTDAVCATMLLARIPLGVPIWEATTTDLQWSHTLWQVLNDMHKIGPAVAGKLLARKRPELIPVVDSVVQKTLACEPGTYWTTLREILKDPGRRRRISRLQPRLPLLRVLDTVIWMHGTGNADSN